MEIARAAKDIGSSLEADVTLCVSDAADSSLFRNVDLAEVAITSHATVEVSGTSPSVLIKQAVGEKCDRCWRVLPEVASRPTHLCDRCTDAVESLPA